MGTTYPGRGYKFYTGKSVLYPFGHGLSFTTFKCSALSVQDTYSSVKVKNVGEEYDSGGVVLLFWKPNEYNIDGPIKRLVAFQRFNLLKIGETININMDLYEE